MKIPSDLRWKSTGRTLGHGGQATVVEVQDTLGEHSGTYALKGLSSGKPAKTYKRFVREIDVLRSISHPGIIQIVDHSIPKSAFHFYVMELIEEAKPLKKLLGTPANPYFNDVLASLSLFVDLLSAIEACEKRSIVHRDLSPSNVLILPDGSPKLIDFGVCQVEDTETITLVDEGVGTQYYTAPECESGFITDEITSRADIYSAGKILWSAITNQHAFAREAPAFGAKSMQSVFPEDPVSWHLHHVFEKTLRHNPNHRWKTAAEALSQVRHIRYVIMAQYPPLELIAEKCPLCGFGNLHSFEHSYQVFGNPNPPGIAAVQCNYCGFCFARSNTVVKENLEARSRLV